MINSWTPMVAYILAQILKLRTQNDLYPFNFNSLFHDNPTQSKLDSVHLAYWPQKRRAIECPLPFYL